MSSSPPNKIRKTDGTDAAAKLSTPPISITGLIDIDCNLLHPDLILAAETGISNISNKTSIIERALRIVHKPSTVASDIIGMLSPSSTLDDVETGLALIHHHRTAATDTDTDSRSKTNIDIRTTAGVHPYHTTDPLDQERMASLLHEGYTKTSGFHQPPIICAIGECGLDYSDGFPDHGLQKAWLAAQLELACRPEFRELPLFIHERLAFDDFCQLVEATIAKHETHGTNLNDSITDEKKEETEISTQDTESANDSSTHNRQQFWKRMVVHCFTGTTSQCQFYILKGCSIGITGYIHKPAGHHLRQALADNLLPLHQIMIETDAPYMGFNGCRESYLRDVEQTPEYKGYNGKKRKKMRKAIFPNVPSALPLVLSGVTDALNEGRTLRGEELYSEAFVGEACTRNAINMFKFNVA